ncbi:MAG: ABC transporter ATP-binding protein [Candidatus Saccharimonadales bacterium]
MKEISRLFSYAKGMTRYVWIAALSSVILAGLSMVMPFAIKFATDEIVAIAGGAPYDSGLLFGVAVVVGVVSVVSAVLRDWSGYIGDMLAIKMRRQLSQNYYKHLLSLPQKYYDEAATGKIINRLNRAITDVTQFLNAFANNLLQMLLTIVISIGVMFWYSPWIALAILVQIPIYLWITALTSKKWQAYEKTKNEAFDIASGRFAEVVGQIRLVKSFGSGKRELASFSQKYRQIQATTKKQSSYWHIMNFYRMLAQALVYVVVLLVLFTNAAEGNMSIGDMVLVLTLVQQTTFPLQNISFFVDMYQRAVANSKDYAEAMNEQPEVTNEAGKETLQAKSATVRYENVAFTYTDKKRVLSDISFKIPAGKKLALVGESGGGKTTIANLLMRLYTPSQGVIRINDKDINQLTQASLREHIATVFQDASLFSGTIRENIAYGNPDATDEEIQRAARAANAHVFIKDLSDGYNTEIGERGIKLSGGQKQRIAIARAVLKDAPILILDEATSALDSRSEMIVQDALQRLMKGRTVLIIAHRLSTIADVDTVVTLKKGQIDEIGAPGELAKTGGIYAELLKLQSGAAKTAEEKLKNFDIAA